MALIAQISESFEKLLRQALPSLLGAYALVAASIYIYWLFNPFPNEYREGAGLHLALLLSDGVNPFGEQAPTAFYYMYGFLAALIAAPFYALSNSDSFTILRLISLLSMVATACLVGWSVRRYSRGSFPALLAGLIALQTGWVTHELVARPDQLAMFLYAASAMLLAQSSRVWSSVCAAVLMVLSFYTKQYFILLSVPLFIGTLLLDWKRGLVFALTICLAMPLSLAVVESVFPRYFTMVVLSYGPAPVVAGHLSLQTSKFFALYWPLVLIVAVGSVHRLVLRRTRHERRVSQRNSLNLPTYSKALSKHQKLILFWSIQFIVGAAFLIYFGRNPGAYLTYFNQFMLLPLVMLAAITSSDIGSTRYRIYLIYTVVFVSLLQGAWWLYLSKPFNSLETAAWERAVATVAQAGPSAEIRSPLFVRQAMQKKLDVFDNGLQAHEWLGQAVVSLRSKQSPILKLFPAAGEVAELCAKYQTVRAQRLKDSTVLLVITDDLTPDSDTELHHKGFEVSDEVPLRSGRQVWSVKFWVKR